MSWPLGVLAAVATLAAIFGKNKVEDVLVAEADSFTRWDPLFKKYATIESVEWTMLKAIAMNESSLGDAKSVRRGLEFPADVEGSKSSDGKSWGLMQITLPTLRDMDPNGNEVKLNDPEYSIRYAAKYLNILSRTFSGEKEWVVKGYNEGPGNASKERAGKISGYAHEYWARYQRNRAIILNKQGV